MTTISSLERLQAPDVAKLLLAEQEAATNPTIAVVDVRDDGMHPLCPPPVPLHPIPLTQSRLTPLSDHIGGHIKGSINAPSQTLDAKMPTLVRQLADKKTVIFHCALSQQRGPGAALKYIRERERMFPKSKTKTAEGDEKGAKGEKEEGDDQKVFVLDRGFVGWQEVYAQDERLTEGYRKELWEDGYQG
jgi:Cdc25 family phosphatase